MDVSLGKTKRWRVPMVAATIAILVAACGNTAPSSETPKNGGTLIWALDSDADTLNPFVMSTLPDYRALSFIMPNLYAADKNLNVIPDLADGMPTVSSDGTVWTVKLKKNGKWSDGTPITADDVLATQKLQADPTLDTDYSYDWSKLKTIEKVDTYTVRYTLNAPFAPFLAVNLAGYIAPAEVFGKVDAAKIRNMPASTTPTVTGGPYKFDKWVPGPEIAFSANLSYYNGRPHYDKVIAKIITDATAAANALINGDVSWHPSLGEAGAGGISKAKAASNVVVHTYEDLGYIDFRMNTRKGHIFDNVLTRQALAPPLDKAAILQAPPPGARGPPVGGLLPPPPGGGAQPGGQ